MYNPQEVAELASEIIKFLKTQSGDIGLKMAACRSAGDILAQTIQAQGLAGVLNNILNGAK